MRMETRLCLSTFCSGSRDRTILWTPCRVWASLTSLSFSVERRTLGRGTQREKGHCTSSQAQSWAKATPRAFGSWCRRRAWTRLLRIATGGRAWRLPMIGGGRRLWPCLNLLRVRRFEYLVYVRSADTLLAVTIIFVFT